MNQPLRWIAVINMWFLASCISVNLPKTESLRSKSVSFRAPKTPFVSSEQDSLDAFWSNPKNGNSISYLSDCNSKNDPTLEAIALGITRSLSNKIIIDTKKIKYNQRKALISEIKGEVDGVDTQLRLLVFKKNGCIYIQTYVGLIESFQSDLPTFELFKKGFFVP